MAEGSENGEIRKDVDDLLRFCSLGFDKQKLERETKEIGNINRAWRRLHLPIQVLHTQDFHWLPRTAYEQFVQSRFNFSRVSRARDSCSISLIHSFMGEKKISCSSKARWANSMGNFSNHLSNYSFSQLLTNQAEKRKGKQADLVGGACNLSYFRIVLFRQARACSYSKINKLCFPGKLQIYQRVT